jgi:predicted O-methyltransferase YrrM
VLEIGTSNGYSTLWLADAARGIGGSVTTVECAEYKIGLASANFARSGLLPFITLVHDDAGRFLQRSEQGAYNLIFLDSERPEYPGWWPHLRRVLRPGGLLIVDNATSHVEQMAPFVALVRADPEFATCLIPVGNGEFLEDLDLFTPTLSMEERRAGIELHEVGAPAHNTLERDAHYVRAPQR